MALVQYAQVASLLDSADVQVKVPANMWIVETRGRVQHDEFGRHTRMSLSRVVKEIRYVVRFP